MGISDPKPRPGESFYCGFTAPTINPITRVICQTSIFYLCSATVDRELSGNFALAAVDYAESNALTLSECPNTRDDSLSRVAFIAAEKKNSRSVRYPMAVFKGDKRAERRAVRHVRRYVRRSTSSHGSV